MNGAAGSGPFLPLPHGRQKVTKHFAPVTNRCAPVTKYFVLITNHCVTVTNRFVPYKLKVVAKGKGEKTENKRVERQKKKG
jgi:hypothetical protein